MKRNRVKASAVIVAGGVGSRMKSDIPKQFIEVLGKPIIAYTLNAVSSCDDIDEIVIVTLPEYIVYCKDVVDAFGFKKVSNIVFGGETRRESVYNGLKEVSKDSDIVVIHDGARPLINPKTIADCIDTAAQFGCAAVGVKMKDTIKVVDSNGDIEYTADREKLWQVQTPQCFRYDIIMPAYQTLIDREQELLAQGITITDDAMVVELLGDVKVKMVEGSYENIKITTPEDLVVAESFLKGDF